MPQPSIGRTVHYRLTELQASDINKRREDARQNLEKMRRERPGFQAHVGNPVEAGETVAMTIVQVWGIKDLVNGQVLLDGNDSLWVTDAHRGDKPGQWCWPPRLREQTSE